MVTVEETQEESAKDGTHDGSAVSDEDIDDPGDKSDNAVIVNSDKSERIKNGKIIDLSNDTVENRQDIVKVRKERDEAARINAMTLLGTPSILAVPLLPKKSLRSSKSGTNSLTELLNLFLCVYEIRTKPKVK